MELMKFLFCGLEKCCIVCAYIHDFVFRQTVSDRFLLFFVVVVARFDVCYCLVTADNFVQDFA